MPDGRGGLGRRGACGGAAVGRAAGRMPRAAGALLRHGPAHGLALALALALAHGLLKPVRAVALSQACCHVHGPARGLLKYVAAVALQSGALPAARHAPQAPHPHG